MLLVPWFDIKALGAILAGVIAALACSARGFSRPGARWGVIAGCAFLVLLGWELTFPAVLFVPRLIVMRFMLS